MLTNPKDRKVAALLAFISAIPMLPSGLHKFYLGQMQWGVLYLLLSWTPIPRFASALEGLWYLFQDTDEFAQNFNQSAIGTSIESVQDSIEPTPVSTIAEALRQIDQLRQEGLLSEYEFEQKRRQLLDRIG
jgi:TM2 domain-containing membrane protein YozV